MGVEGFIQKPLSFEQVSEALEDICKIFTNNSMVELSYNCSYNNLSKEIYVDNKKIDITLNEQKFIEFLIKNYNLNSDIKDIFNYIYYDEPQKIFSVDSIKGLVKRLRKKLPSGLILHTRTTGYTLTLN